MHSKRKDYIKTKQKIVVKVGSSTLTHHNGLLNLERIEMIVRQIADLHNRGFQVILVTSGAIGAGMGKLGMKVRPKTIPDKQAAAAVGQGILLHMYEKLFSEYGKIVAQLLITKEDFNDRTRFLNVRNAFFSLLEKDVIPIINENDAVVVDEIKFGDNDTLSALVASLVEANLLIILSDIDGLYNENPKDNPNAKLITWVDEITDEIEGSAGGSGSAIGTGGMVTKLKAGKIAVSSGTSMVIANGSIQGVLNKVVNGEDVGTWFKSQEQPLQSRKHWMAYGTSSKGILVVDSGAANALTKEMKSLLASGIKEVSGTFKTGSIIKVVDDSNIELARGIVNYSSDEIKQIKGLKSGEIEQALGYKYYDEVIHRNNMVLI